MKKFLLLISLIFILIGASAQTTTQKNISLFVRGGYSWFTGVVGGELQIGHIGLGGGWMPTKKPLSGDRENAFGMCASYYTKNPYENSMYISFGYIINGYRKESTSGSYITGNMLGSMIGYKWATKGFDIKAGVGAGFYDGTTTFTGEITIGLDLLAL